MRQIATDGTDPVRAGDRTMPRHHRGRVQRDHRVAGRHPVGDRARPHNRGATDEQQIPGEQHTGVGHVHDRVGGGVRGTEVEQVDSPAAELDGQVAVERQVGVAQLDAAEVKVTEAITQIPRRNGAQVGGLDPG
ncbi:Uncharacterised protein [Mycobacterium tuberculosis]|uniref:Uncharacterized protein n=1 Tax=Mycobacterium tuberculosis TaxID=1773 RepID=A0A655I0U6_MYCTX|nr:Uncharacterised protein [Mycobacterium tuberculosis]